MLVVTVALSVNLMSATLDQVISKRKKVVEDMATHMIGSATYNVAHGPTWQVLRAHHGTELATSIVHDALQHSFATITEREPKYYDDDTNLGSAVIRSQTLSRETNDWPRHMAILARAHLPFEALASRGHEPPPSLAAHGGGARGGGDEGSPFMAAAASPMGAGPGPAGPGAVGPGASEIEGIEGDAHYLRALLSAEHLDLMGRGLGTNERPALVGLLSTNTSLRSLNLLCNDLSEEEAEELAHLARGRLVSLCGVDEGEDDVALDRGRGGGQKLQPPDGILLASDLLTRPIKHLHVSENAFGERGAKAIAGALRVTTEGLHTKLQTLDISLCGLGAAGGEAIAKALTAKSPTLKALNVAFNRIGPVGAAAFGHMLAKNCALTELNLHYNSMGDAGAAAISEGLIRNRAGSRLATLAISSNDVTTQGITALMSMVVAMNGRRLRALDVRWNAPGESGKDAIGIAREMSPQMQIILESQEAPRQALHGPAVPFDAGQVLQGLSRGIVPPTKQHQPPSPRRSPSPRTTASPSRGLAAPTLGGGGGGVAVVSAGASTPIQSSKHLINTPSPQPPPSSSRRGASPRGRAM